ncbi:MAG: glutathione S-transferase family protein [Polyangiaceae bacterium]|nr:glutathione S-transferase family protein [Polyangiaceae bacterium]
MLRLHYHPLSPYSRKASTAIALRGDAVELCEIALGSGALQRPEFLALSPFGKMPVLETPDEGPIIESTSIIEYLEAKGPPVLLPPGAARAARHFDRLGDLYLVEPVAAWFWERTSPAGQAAPERARRAWALFEARLSGRAFVCGDAFGLGDLAGAIATDYFEREGVEPPAAIRAWKDRCFAIPAMRASLEAAVPWVESTRPMRQRGA